MKTVIRYYICRNGAVVTQRDMSWFEVVEPANPDSPYENNYPNECRKGSRIALLTVNRTKPEGGAHGIGWDAVDYKDVKITGIKIRKDFVWIAAAIAGAMLAWWIL